jgi:hypothetical protein
MGSLCGGLMGSSPERPGNDVSGSDFLAREARGDAPDFLHRPVDQ